MLVRSGVWSTLTPPERSLLPVLCSFVATESREPSPISYHGLMRHSGVRSTATVSAALRHFQQMGLLQVVRASGEQSLRAVNRYRLTGDCPQFQELVIRTFQQQREEIEAEKQIQAEARKARSQRRTVQVNTLFTDCTAGRFAASARVKTGNGWKLIEQFHASPLLKRKNIQVEGGPQSQWRSAFEDRSLGHGKHVQRQ